MKYFIYLLSLCILSSNQAHSELGVWGAYEYTKKKISKKCWVLPSEDAALAMANELKRDEEIVKLVKKIKPLSSGYITYSGSTNFIGAGNRLIRFGDKAVQYHIDFSRGHRSFFSNGYAKNTTKFSCTKRLVSQEALLACEVTQHLRGMTRKNKADSFAISRDMVYGNPPSLFDTVQVYDSNGKRMLWQEDSATEIDWLGDKYSWISNFSEAILLKSEAFKEASITKVSNDPSQRAGLILMVREILKDDKIPAEFTTRLVEGVNAACLYELKEDIAELSTRVPEVKAYAKRYVAMVESRKGRDIRLAANPKNEEDVIYHKLMDRFHKDKPQVLRREIDSALKSLNAVGDEERIVELMDKGVDVEHLIYDMRFKDSESCDRLILRNLKQVKSGYEHSKLISAMLKAGREKVLIKYLEGVNEQKFSLCCHHMVSQIRKLRPDWKLKLQIGLIRYVKENKDAGHWTHNTAEELMPEENPSYFDSKVVGECLNDPKVRKKIIEGDFYKKPDAYNLLLKKWKDSK